MSGADNYSARTHLCFPPNTHPRRQRLESLADEILGEIQALGGNEHLEKLMHKLRQSHSTPCERPAGVESDTINQ